MKKVLIILSLFFLTFSCNKNEENYDNNVDIHQQNKKIQIVSSIVPISSVINYIGGDEVDVENLIPVGVSPHSYDLKTQDMLKIKKSDIVAFLGIEGIDEYLEKVVENSQKLTLSKGIELVNFNEIDNKHEEHEEYEEHVHIYDPHIWLSTTNIIKIGHEISDRLSEIKPEKKGYFENNLKNFEEELLSIKKSYFDNINDKNESKFIVFHDAYNYLLDELDINLSNKIIFRKSVLNNPNTKELKELLDTIKDEHIKILFKEPQFENTKYEDFFKEHNIKVLTIDPLGQQTGKEGYINNYKNNLESLKNIYEG